MTRLTPESVREMLAPERANLAWPTDVASDIARAYLDAIAEVERLRAAVETLAEREDAASAVAYRQGQHDKGHRHEYAADVLREALK